MLEWSDPNSRNLLFQSPRCFSSHSSISWHDTMRGKFYPRGNSTRLSPCFPYISGEIVPLSPRFPSENTSQGRSTPIPLLPFWRYIPGKIVPLSPRFPFGVLSQGNFHPYPLVSLRRYIPGEIVPLSPLFHFDVISQGRFHPYFLVSFLRIYPRGNSTSIPWFPLVLTIPSGS